MKLLAILGATFAVPILLLAALAGLGLVVLAVALAPLLVALSMFSAAAYAFEQALFDGRRPSKRATAKALQERRRSTGRSTAEAHTAPHELGRMLAHR